MANQIKVAQAYTASPISLKNKLYVKRNKGKYSAKLIKNWYV